MGKQTVLSTTGSEAPHPAPGQSCGAIGCWVFRSNWRFVCTSYYHSLVVTSCNFCFWRWIRHENTCFWMLKSAQKVWRTQQEIEVWTIDASGTTSMVIRNCWVTELRLIGWQRQVCWWHIRDSCRRRHRPMEPHKWSCRRRPGLWCSPKLGTSHRWSGWNIWSSKFWDWEQLETSVFFTSW